MSELVRLIQEIAGNRNHDTTRLLTCTVVSVDGENRTATVTTDSGDTALTFDANLMAAIGDGILLYPEVDSTVYVLMSKYILPVIVQYSDITDINFLGGEHGGLVKVIELTQKINLLENKVNELINRLNTLTLPVSGATAGPPVDVPTQPLQNTVRGDIENVNITHGSYEL